MFPVFGAKKMSRWPLWVVMCMSAAGFAWGRTVPVSVERIRSFADAVIVVQVSSTIRTGPGSFEVRGRVQEVVFDRDNMVAAGGEIEFVESARLASASFFSEGGAFIVSIGRCDKEVYSVFGHEFSARLDGDLFLTDHWIGIEKKASLSELKKKLIPPLPKNRSVAELECQHLRQS